MSAVWLRRPAVRVCAGRPGTRPSGEQARFMTDFLADFGMEPDWELYARGGGNSFIEMSQELLDSLDRPLPALDAALLAYHLPDHTVIEVAGCYLAQRCTGSPAVFSVAGQGVGAPFTSLRILACMRQAGELSHGAVFVFDHGSAPYWDADVHDGPIRDSTVQDSTVQDCAALLCIDAVGAAGAAVLDFVDERPAADPAKSLTMFTAHIPAVRIAAGRMLADRLDPEFLARHGVTAGGPGQLCTSAWAALAAAWPYDRYTVAADYDPHSGRLFQVGLRPGATA